MGRFSLPRARWGIKPPGPVNADLVRYNCARLGLPVPSSLVPFSERGGTARDVMTALEGALTGATWEPDGVLSNADGERVGFASPLVNMGTHTVGTISMLWRQANANATTRCLVAGSSSAFVVNQAQSTGVWTCFPGNLTGTYATSPTGGLYATTWRWGTGAALLRINGTTVISSAAAANLTTSLTSTAFASRNADAGRYLNGVMLQAAIWREQLTEAQIAAWEADPYALLAPPPRAIYFDLAAGGGTIPVTSDLAALFDVRNTVARDLAARFDILNTVALDLGIPFDIREFVTSDEQLVFDIEGSGLSVISDLAAFFDVRNTVVQDLAIRFDLLNSVVADVGVSYDVRAFTNQDIEVVFDIGGLALSDIRMLFDMAGSVFSDLTVRYNVGLGGLKIRILGSSFRRFLS